MPKTRKIPPVTELFVSVVSLLSAEHEKHYFASNTHIIFHRHCALYNIPEQRLQTVLTAAVIASGLRRAPSRKRKQGGGVALASPAARCYYYSCFTLTFCARCFATSSSMRASDEDRAHWKQRGPLMLLFG